MANDDGPPQAAIRLTAMLRSRLSDVAPVTIEREVLDQRVALDAVRPFMPQPSTPSPADFSWAAFSAGAPPTADAAVTSAARGSHAGLLATVRTVVGPTLTPEELQAACKWVYRLFGKLDTEPTAKNTADARERFVTRFGAVSDDQWGTLGRLCGNMRAFRGPLSPEAPPTTQSPLAAICPSRVPFGDAMLYTAASVMPPARLTPMSAPSAAVPPTLPTFAPPAPAPPAVPDVVDAAWLVERCGQHVAITGMEGFDAESMALATLRALKTRGGDAAVQTALADVVGLLGDAEGAFDFMQLLLSKRRELHRVTDADVTAAARGTAAAPVGFSSRGFTVKTTSQIQAAKDRRRADRREARRGGSAGAALQTPSRLPSGPRAKPRDDYKHGLPVGEGSALSGDAKRLLPPGTKTTYHTGYKKVFVPPPGLDEEESKTADAARVPISTLDPIAQKAFAGTKSLNRLQSVVFPVAYRTNENMLVCAPTGAGKTNVALLSVIHEISQHYLHGILQKDGFKVVYVAPMKALAQEVQQKFSQRLKPLGVTVRELTGDMQLTRREIDNTQMIVTTPEKWDVITRKNGSGGDSALVSLVRLLIIDEVHLLADGRGAVIESLVARTLRMVESTQSAVRIVGLSATLPNYMDVALFLRVNPSVGLFHFGDAHRPVPLEQTFVGVTEPHPMRRLQRMNELAFDIAIESVKAGNQAMVFVHSRKDTARTAQEFRDIALKRHMLHFLNGEEEGENPLDGHRMASLRTALSRSRNRDVKDLVSAGLGIHHAGMMRSDRNLSENLFSKGVVKVLVCTATLAWGVNLPAHTVIIKGTQVYNAERGGFTDLSLLDVGQIFGRAGRPQFDTSGEGVIITTEDRLDHYLGMLTHQMPIESNFIKALPDHLNAEIVSGTVTNVQEAARWLSYTYLFVRMLRNPMVYGIPYEERAEDPELEVKRMSLIATAARRLDDCRMVRFEEGSGMFGVTDLGRVASHFYIQHGSVEVFNTLMKPVMTDEEIINIICHAHEFDNIKIRDEELEELDKLKSESHFSMAVAVENKTGKTNILLQAYISRVMLRGFTLISDTNFITQSAGRITRALFETALRRGWATAAERLLEFCKAIDKRLWFDESPLHQFDDVSPRYVQKLDAAGLDIDALREMSGSDIGSVVRIPVAGRQIAAAVHAIPLLEIEYHLQPITRNVLKVTLTVYPAFTWNDRLHGNSEPWWIWVEDTESERIYHHEYLLLQKRQVLAGEPIELNFTIPVFEPLPPQYWVRATSDRWLGSSTVVAMSFKHLLLPEDIAPHTDLLDLQPLPIAAMKNTAYQSLYNFTHFNPIQTQLFHVAYHTDHNMLVGAPTGSGKTMVAELTVFRLMTTCGRAPPGSTVIDGTKGALTVTRPRSKAVYVAPLKALVSERVKDWRRKFKAWGWAVEELTGDATPDAAALSRSDILITTPEKWDGVSRSWKQRNYVKQVGLVIIDEIHLLGEDRGPVLEVIVSRMRYIAAQTATPVRVVGLSTALANAVDLADWLGVERVGLFNFRPSVRPIPMEVHIQGFPGKYYCPRMATMNKPVYQAILTHSPRKPALVFVASRRQTRLTALELISLCATDDNPRQFLHKDEAEVAALCDGVTDQALKHTLGYGVGLHHAGLNERDRTLVETLFCDGSIQVLVCTSTLAWGVNFPAHLVVVKGTEFFDGKTCRYKDFPVTDVLQMMGRAGRPQFDTHGVAVILVHEPKKNFYRKFLYEPFPVESHLKDCLHNHIVAEVAGGTISSRQDAVDYLTWTYFFRRLLKNPGFYGLDSVKTDAVRSYLMALVDGVLDDLAGVGVIDFNKDDTIVPLATLGPRPGADASDTIAAPAPAVAEVAPTTLGLITSYYYLQYTTVNVFHKRLTKLHASGGLDFAAMLRLVSDAPEFDELPVRHNEDELNARLDAATRFHSPAGAMDDPHTKAFLLLQAHMQHLPLPISDYINDTKSVMDQSLRVLNALIDVAADAGIMAAVLHAASVSQCILQSCMPDGGTIRQLPGMNDAIAAALTAAVLEAGTASTAAASSGSSGAGSRLATLGDVLKVPRELRSKHLRHLRGGNVAKVIRMLAGIPNVVVAWEAQASGGLRVNLDVVNDGPVSKTAPRSRFPKAKQFGWWIAVATARDTELLALKRITIPARGHASHVLSFDAGAVRDGLTLHLLSDCLSGLDQRHVVEV